MTDGSSTDPGHECTWSQVGTEEQTYCLGCGRLSSECSVDEINEGIRQALAKLDGSLLSAVSLLTGMSIEKLIELGGGE
jgi:hypothetical protein